MRSALLCVLSVLPAACATSAGADMATRWQRLCQAGGCLAGGQDWKAGGVTEGSVLRTPRWRDFLGAPRDEVVPFLLDRIDSTEQTSVHVCPFQNALEGELAVYSLQHLLEANRVDGAHGQKAIRALLGKRESRERVKGYFARLYASQGSR
ncbi:MAG: hypothetical protein ACYS99_03970 [Planctomycetota bacterium]